MNLQGNESSLILEQITGIDMLTQEGESNSVSNALLQNIFLSYLHECFCNTSTGTVL